MAIFVKTTNPQELVNNIKKQIEDGKIDTWLCDKDGDFTHNTEQWRYHAWLRPVIESDRVVFGILGRKDKYLSLISLSIS